MSRQPGAGAEAIGGIQLRETGCNVSVLLRPRLQGAEALKISLAAGVAAAEASQAGYRYVDRAALAERT